MEYRVYPLKFSVRVLVLGTKHDGTDDIRYSLLEESSRVKSVSVFLLYRRHQLCHLCCNGVFIALLSDSQTPEHGMDEISVLLPHLPIRKGNTCTMIASISCEIIHTKIHTEISKCQMYMYMFVPQIIIFGRFITPGVTYKFVIQLELETGGIVVYWNIHSTPSHAESHCSNLTIVIHFRPSARQFIHIAALDPGV